MPDPVATTDEGRAVRALDLPRSALVLPARPIARRLHRGHFAFMRALVEGLDTKASWNRYLRIKGNHRDSHSVARTIAWIRDAFAAAARRHNRKRPRKASRGA